MSKDTAHSNAEATASGMSEPIVNSPFLAPDWNEDYSCGYARAHLLILCDEVVPVERQIRAQVDELGFEADFQNPKKHEIFLDSVEQTLSMVEVLEKKPYFQRLSSPWETNGRAVEDEEPVVKVIEVIQNIRLELSQFATMLRDTPHGKMTVSMILPIKDQLSQYDTELWDLIETSLVPKIWTQQ